MSKLRIGHGFDVHAFEPGDHLMLGGVRIPFDRQFKAHSDGDVLIHALCDALLGAAAMGDIGRHFPDNSAEFKNINSRELLCRVKKQLDDNTYQVVNCDITIIAQKPRMADYLHEMIENLSADLAISAQQINIKATTTEKLGYTGREEGISVHAVTLLEQV